MVLTAKFKEGGGFVTLQTDIQAVIDESDIEAGVSVWHVESGEQTDVNGSMFFPMASVFKIPVLTLAGQRLAAGMMNLEDRVTLTEEAKSTGSGVLRYFQPGVGPTFRDLLTLMIIISDNTATDILMKRLGIPAITARMQALGLNHLHVPLTVRGIFNTMLPNADPTQDLYQLEQDEQKAGPRNDALAYQLVPDNNVGTAREMTQLLGLIYDGRVPDRAGGDGALGILLQQQLNDRLPRFLPAGVRVAHKTGTLGGVRNDAGIIYARPDSHVALTVFTRWDDLAVWDDPRAARRRAMEVDSAIGEIGRLVYDAYR
jgi:beta-lactamase class A